MGTTVGSLCTGILGLDLAVEAHYGARIAWHSEIESSVAAVIARHTDSPNLGDLTTIDWRNVEPVDILTAGYPCQPFSHAGNRKGASDVRHLWPYIADAVRVLRPRRVVLENVAGHLSLGFDVVLGDLAEAGFDAEWCVLRASDVGAPHQRARLFVVATNANRSDGRGWSEARRVSETSGAGDQTATPDAGGERHGGGQDTGAVGRVDRGDAGEARQRQRPWEVAGDRGSETPADAAGLPEREPSDEAHTLTGGRQARPVPGGGSGSSAPDADDCGQVPRQDHSRPREPNVAGGAHRSTIVGARTDWGPYAPAIDRWERTLGRPAPGPTDDAGRLSPPFVEWMMGYPAGWAAELSRTEALKALGNAVVPQQAAAALTVLDPCGAVASYP